MSSDSSPGNRLISLDALRGYTIVLMVIVNDPGSWSHVYAPLLHAEWHGVTLTDLVFPLFLFIVGVSITLAYSKHADSDPKGLHRKIVLRSLKLLLLGWFLWLWPDFDFDTMRFVGVLPRIAIVFLVCALLFLHTNWRQQVWIGGTILIAYWLLLAFVPVPVDGVVRNALATGQVESSGGPIEVEPLRRLSEDFVAANYEPGVNITAWLDRRMVPGTFWQVTWDPEGLMSTFPSIVTCILGLLVGRMILSLRGEFERLTWIFFTGFCLYLAGGAWGWFMPMNKNLWSSSYTLWTAGLCTMALAACMLVVDSLGYTRGTKLGRVYGANAIASYVLAGLLIPLAYRPLFGDRSISELWMDALTGLGITPKLASLGFAVLYMLVVYVPARFLYQRKIFLKV